MRKMGREDGRERESEREGERRVREGEREREIYYGIYEIITLQGRSQRGFPLPGSYFLRSTVCFICCMYITRQSCEHMRSEVGLARQGKLKRHNTTVQRYM